jgi:hypothetical protein
LISFDMDYEAKLYESTKIYWQWCFSLPKNLKQ